jgi:hypothetical protein
MLQRCKESKKITTILLRVRICYALVKLIEVGNTAMPVETHLQTPRRRRAKILLSTKIKK